MLGVNISDFAVTNADVLVGDYGGYPTVDTHIVTTAYDFSWPSGQDISSQLLDTGLCMTVLSTPTDMPVSLTNAYTNDQVNNASCIPVLGQACVGAILRGHQSSSGGILGVCQAPPVIWSDLAECQSTLGYVQATSGVFGMLTTPLLFSNESSNATTTTTHDWARGRGWFGSFSSPQNGSASPAYYTAANRLHIVMVTTPPLQQGTSASSRSTDGSGYVQVPELLCMRVNATQLLTPDPNGDGVTWTSEAVMENMGGLVQTTAAGALSMWVLTALAFYLAV
jgi:hypothetical protein